MTNLNHKLFQGRNQTMLEDSNAWGYHACLPSSQWDRWGIQGIKYATSPLPKDADIITELWHQHPDLVVEHGHPRYDTVPDAVRWIASIEDRRDLPNHAYYPGDWMRNIVSYRAHKFNQHQPTLRGIITVRNPTPWKNRLLDVIHSVPGRQHILTAIQWDRPDLDIQHHRLASELHEYDPLRSPAFGCKERGSALSIIVAEHDDYDQSEKWYQAMCHPAIVVHWSNDHRDLQRELGFDPDYEGIPEYHNSDGTINEAQFQKVCEMLWDWPHSMDLWHQNHKRIQHNMAWSWRIDCWEEFCRGEFQRIGMCE